MKDREGKEGERGGGGRGRVEGIKREGVWSCMYRSRYKKYKWSSLHLPFPPCLPLPSPEPLSFSFIGGGVYEALCSPLCLRNILLRTEWKHQIRENRETLTIAVSLSHSLCLSLSHCLSYNVLSWRWQPVTVSHSRDCKEIWAWIDFRSVCVCVCVCERERKRERELY